MAVPRYLNLVAGILKQIVAVETGPASAPTEQIVSTDSSGLISPTLLPGGLGGVTIIASEALAAGDFVNVFNAAGTANARKADGSVAGKNANGYVLASVLITANATVYTQGVNTAVTGATPGEIYLSDATPGGFTSTPPSTAAHIVQRIGTAVSATAIAFQPYAPVTLA